jgi:cephalosporin hydroxylase
MVPITSSQTVLSVLTTWWAQPFNGQLIRFTTCVEVCQRFKPQIAIETGTFYGTTTVALSSLVSGQTFTIELNQEYANLASTYFRAIGLDENRIKLIRGDSSTEIVNVLSQINKDSRILVYLDAHWGEKLPLQDELSALINWGGAFVVIIDDFYVYYDNNFGFDSYGGNKLDLSLIPKNFSGHIFLPSHPAGQEYGARRGTCFLISSKAALFISDMNFTHLKHIEIEKH